MREFRKALGDRGRIYYASKAFCCKEICRIAQSEGLGIDVVSAGELYTALEAGFNPANICMHGNNKTPSELKLAVESGVGRIVVDNFEELKWLSDKEATIMLRIKPGVDAHTHEYVKTGNVDSKFGFALDEALEAVKFALKTNLKLTGIHCHIGSQIFSAETFALAAKIMTNFLAEIKKETGVLLTELNLGGGFGFAYTEEDVPLSAEEAVKTICETVSKTANEHGISVPFLMLEPGRLIVAESGVTLYTVGSVKAIPGVRTYVITDGGMFDNPRYALYKAKFEMLIASKATLQKDTIVTVAGKCCESGDLLGENVPLQNAEAGDILAVLSTGAYTFSMASNYNRNPRPPVVTVSGGKDRVIVNASHPKSLCENDV